MKGLYVVVVEKKDNMRSEMLLTRNLEAVLIIHTPSDCKMPDKITGRHCNPTAL